MIKRYKKMIALGVAVTFLTLLPIYSLPLPAEQALNQDKEAMRSADQAQNFIEKEQQVGYQASPKNILPVILIIAAVTAGVFLLVMLVSKDKYDITGNWKFHNDYTTAGGVDFDSDWVFTSDETQFKAIGSYVRYEADGSFVSGRYTVVNKNEVVFLDFDSTEQYVGQFDSKTTMSGTFVVDTGAKGNWTATKK